MEAWRDSLAWEVRAHIRRGEHLLLGTGGMGCQCPSRLGRGFLWRDGNMAQNGGQGLHIERREHTKGTGQHWRWDIGYIQEADQINKHFIHSRKGET